MKKSKVLVTGSAGFLGSSMCYELLKNGYEVIGLDSYQNSNETNTKKLDEIFKDSYKFYEINLANQLDLLIDIFKIEKPETVIHFAAEKSVNISKKQPIYYWENNLYSTINIVKAMNCIECSKFIYSSSAAVYGNSTNTPVKEDNFLNPISPYAQTKLACEMFIKDISNNKDFKSIILRYFNPVCSHLDQVIHDDLEKDECSLIQEIVKTALGKNKTLKIFGSEYDTNDGTCERDYIHTQDLLDAHFKSMEYLDKIKETLVINVGTGKPVSILELVRIFENENKVEINYEFDKKRDGDITTSYADVSKINRELGWKSKRDISDIVIDAWKPFKI
tara:strand:+ start:1037 stop:2038 length:1002 start_codon:yes stop_codon:yes gene_type:complete